MNFHVVGAVGCQLMGLPRTANALLAQGPIAAKAWSGWAEQNDFVRRTLETATIAGGAVGVVVAYLPVVATAATELRERRFGPTAEAEAPEPVPPPPTEAYPGTGDINPDGFAYVAPTGTDGNGSTY